MTGWCRDLLAKKAKCFPPAVTNKWRPADRECEAVWELSHTLSKVAKPSAPCQYPTKRVNEKRKKNGSDMRHWRSPKEINTETRENRSLFFCDLGAKTSTSFPHLLLEKELRREANFPCPTWQEDIIPHPLCRLGLGIENQFQFQNRILKVRNRIRAVKLKFRFRLSIPMRFFFFICEDLT